MRHNPAKKSTKANREGSFSIRVRPQQKYLIDKAAELLGTTRSDFMLDLACREAEAILLDRRFFGLTPEKFKAFTDKLNESPSDNKRLRKLFAIKEPWSN